MSELFGVELVDGVVDRVSVGRKTASTNPHTTQLSPSVDRGLGASTYATSRDATQRAFGIAQQRSGLPQRLFGDPGQLSGDPLHHGLSLQVRYEPETMSEGLGITFSFTKRSKNAVMQSEPLLYS